jgi:hypothetical protein
MYYVLHNTVHNKFPMQLLYLHFNKIVQFHWIFFFFFFISTLKAISTPQIIDNLLWYSSYKAKITSFTLLRELFPIKYARSFQCYLSLSGDVTTQFFIYFPM